MNAKLSTKLHKILHSKTFLTTSGSLAGAGWFLKDQWPQASWQHNVCVAFVGIGLYLGTWSSTGRAMAPTPPENPPK